MNLRLNMKEINKDISKSTLKIYFILNIMRRNNTYLQKHVSMKLRVMPSLLPPVL